MKGLPGNNLPLHPRSCCNMVAGTREGSRCGMLLPATTSWRSTPLPAPSTLALSSHQQTPPCIGLHTHYHSHPR